MADTEASIENLMDDEIMELLLKADKVKPRDVWNAVGLARAGMSGSDEPASPSAGAAERLSLSAGKARIRRESGTGRERRQRGHV